MSRSVKYNEHRKPARAKRSQKRVFSQTADRTDKINSNRSGRPMRGGIRL